MFITEQQTVSGNKEDQRSSRYALGYEVAEMYGLTHPEIVAVDGRSEEFQMGFWDCIGDKVLRDTAQ